MATAKKKAPGTKKAGTSKDAARQRKLLFVEGFFVNNENITKAAVYAGFSKKTAAQQGSRLLKDVETQQLIRERRASLVQVMGLSTERTLQEVARLAYFDPRKLFDETGRPKPLHELDDDTAAAIAGLEVVDKYEKPVAGAQGGNVATVLKYKLANKAGALEIAMRHLGLYEKDNKQRSLLEGADRETLKAIAEYLRGSGA